MIRVADLFAGAGGMSTGCLKAAEARGEQVELVAVNHWPISVATHTVNHPEARHYCAPVETLDPRVAIPSGKLDILIAAPECTHHSTARGGKPINDQSRASAWHILRWIELLRVETVLIENVSEFQTWGPLGVNHRPLKSKRGEIFRAFIQAIERYGYRVEFKVLNAADYGAATTRRRLFIIAKRGAKSINWPVQTHSKTGANTLFAKTKKWRAAREVIDWSLPSQSIFKRKRPLKPATMRRIFEGLRRFGGKELEPFLVQLTHGGRTYSADAPMPTVTTASRGEIGVVQPYIVTQRNNNAPKSLNDPIPALCTGGHIALAQPFLIPFYGENGQQAPRTHAVDEPVPTIPTDPKFGVVQPFVLQQQSGGVPRSVSDPAPTIAAGGAISLVEPFLMPTGGRAVGRADSVDQPVRTLTAAAGHTVGLVEPFLTEYYGNGGAQSVDIPVPTVTTRDRFALVQPIVDGYVLDIKFRMLQPHELAGAMSFPKSYVFTGNKGDQIRQIGNAVDCSMSQALCGAILDSRREATPRRRKAVA